jgi:adenosyl cobinamide kinase/adenosyl cobinamide phosphate guanylyltransferase/cobalamin synthase
VITLVLGGVRSGKSEVAERLAGPGPVTYVATGMVRGDEEFAARVARHRERRPPGWSTVEEPKAVPDVLRELVGCVLLDALGTWVANVPDPDLDDLVAALTARAGDTIVVSEEVGLGVHPVTEVGRHFADTLGEANRRVAEVADRCLLVVAGRVVELPGGTGPGPPSLTAPATDSPAVAGGFRSAVAFLTPVGGAALPGPATMAWLPVVGALIGLGLGGLWWGAVQLLGPLAGAAVVVAADLAVTGALHFDGLVDSADGLLPHLSRRRRLEVMAEPGVGAFGLALGASTLLLRAAALAALAPARPLLLAALWSASRWSMALCARSGTYARPGGLATAFLGGSPAPVLAGALLPFGLAIADRPASLVAVAAAGGAGALVHALARRRIGGFTGDTLGAAGVTAETAGLLVALAVA